MTRAQPAFVEQIRTLEQKLFPELLDPAQPTRLKSPGYSWLYRPSHHVKSGLVTEGDIERLRQGGRLLSVGAYPAALERVIVALGVPESALFIADKLPEILHVTGAGKALCFDVCGRWPDTGTFDFITFPESLCIAITDHLPDGLDRADRDRLEAALLAHVLSQALRRLRPGGEIRANGPMSHPKVVQMTEKHLTEEGFDVTVDYARFFLRVRRERAPMR